jgi:DhnA family fructose-bisphosphate aldolase class Ia
MQVMSLGKQLRQRRLMGRGRTVIVAMDHGVSAGAVAGLENPRAVLKTISRAKPDGILVTPGVLETIVEEIEDLAILLRIDGCTGPREAGPMRLFGSIEDAVALGVDGVVMNATIGTPYQSDELHKIGLAATAGRRWGMPLVAEILSQRMLSNHMDMSGTGKDELPPDIDRDVAMACRFGIELGADAIKTRYPGDRERFREIVACTDRPILVAGGPLRDASLYSTLHLVDEVLQAGAAGVILGRTIWQRSNPVEALRAVCAMIHEDATVEEALEAAVV